MSPTEFPTYTTLRPSLALYATTGEVYERAPVLASHRTPRFEAFDERIAVSVDAPACRAF
jgi:hypothetical protein